MNQTSEIDKAATIAGKLLEIIKATRPRRSPVANGWHQYYWEGKPQELLVWIHANTTGLFYMDYRVVAFADERDALIFKLGYKHD